MLQAGASKGGRKDETLDSVTSLTLEDGYQAFYKLVQF